jgi:hypothetical protein
VTTSIPVLNGAGDTITEVLTYNQCSPMLSVPTKLYTLDPGWESCQPFMKGLWDPPYALTPGQGLLAPPAAASTNDPPSVPQVTPSSSSGGAAAGATPSPGTATKTGDPKSTTSTAASGPATNGLPADPPTQTQDLVITVGASTVTGNSAAVFVFGTTSLSPGGPPVTIADTAYSLTSDGTNLVVITSKLASGPVSTPIITIGAATIPGDSASVFVVGTTWLSLAGQPITISGTAYLLTTDGNNLVVITSKLSSNPTSDSLVIGTQTLAAGGSAITISGTVLSLKAGGQTIVVGGVTQDLSSWLQVISITTSSGGLASIIAEMGGFATPTPTLTPTSVAGNASAGFNGLGFSGLGARVVEPPIWAIGCVLTFGIFGVWVL